MRPRPTRTTVLLACALTAFAAIAGGCKVTGEDIETWKGTVKGPGKIIAVMMSESYPLDLRTAAALALVEMEPRQSPEVVDGVAELQSALQRLDDATRRQIIEGMVPDLEVLMRGGDAAPVQSGEAPPDLQVRAKDASYLLISQAEGESRDRLVAGVVAWYVVDFNGRNLAGNYSAEQIIRSLGSQAAGMLVDALDPKMPGRALIMLTELISQLGEEETKARAAAAIVELERHMEGEEFLEWLKEPVIAALRETNPDAEPNADRVGRLATLNRENFITTGAIPAMKYLASEDIVRERLLTIAGTDDASAPMVVRRMSALLALEGNVAEPHLDRLLALALTDGVPPEIQDVAFARVGDIRSTRAIPAMWPLVELGDNDKQRYRWRAAEMVLQIGGGDVVGEFFAKLPEGDEVKYEPEELEGYATRMAHMSPLPTQVVRGQLSSPQWFDRVIALRYFERKGEEGDIRAMQRLTRDQAEVVGNGWEALELGTVGQVAEAAITALQERLSSDNAEEATEDAEAE